MPKIDPSQLLSCLDSLLGSDGGIKGEMEVKRLAILMTKFSKKLVSKCIYILILKSTEPDLLAKFMAEGGWALVFQWLDEGICNNNYALIREILELLLKCPISLDRLKENNCPKVVKGLSKDSESEEVKRLASKLVEQWLKFIKSGQAAISDVAMAATSSPVIPKSSITVLPSNITVVSTVSLNSTSGAEIKKQSSLTRKVSKSSGFQLVREVSVSEEEEEEEEDDYDEDNVDVPPIGSLPLYKITVRDGKSVLAKVGTKTLTLPVTKKAESDIEPNTVASVVLKSDSISKKIRYVTKPVSEKVPDASEQYSNDSSCREKSDGPKSINSTTSENLSRQKIGSPEKNEIKKLDESETEDKLKLSEFKVKQSSSKSSKDSSSKSKDGHSKVSKIGREHESYKSESKHKDKEKKSSRDSEKDRKKGEHKSHKTDKSRDRDRDRNRDRDREKEKSKSKESSKEKHKEDDRSKSKDKPSKEKEGKLAERSLSAAEKAQIQADKDRNTLERLKTPTISLLGKIPKKPSSQSVTTSGKPNNVVGKPAECQESSEKIETGSVGDSKKPAEVRSPKSRPKTVKTFNSKFRSTGLEEEIKPPPPRSSIKKKADEKRPPARLDGTMKTSSTGIKDGQPPEKKPKLGEMGLEKKDKIVEKPGGIKLIPPKPKPALLESDMFSDALTASTKFEPRKRKRRTSNSRDGSDVKKEDRKDSKEDSSHSVSSEVTSPKDIKPALKFYRDTLEDDEEKNKENAVMVKAESKTESDSEDSIKQSSSEGGAHEMSKPGSKLFPNGVLVYKAKKGPKKSVKWKEDAELTAIRLFELDETERVNVTRTFVDMKLMERSHEREAFQLARKLATEDIMEERIPWGPLYEIDIPPDRRCTVEPGKSSLEKNVQYAREKTVLQAIYFHRSSIPDSPAEPDSEIHPTTDPKIIPLDDITGNSDSVSNFQNIPWPEPKPSLVPLSPPQAQSSGGSQHLQSQHHHQQPHQQQQQQQLNPQQPGQGQNFNAGYSSVGSFQGFPQMGMPGMMPHAQGNWRGGDGKEMGMNMTFQPNGPLCPQMGQPPSLFNATGPENFAMNGPPMGGGFNPGFPMPCDPNMFGPPMGNMGMGGPPPSHWNRGGGGWQGGRPFMGPMNMQMKFQKGVCHHFAKFGNCNRGSSCRFIHPN